MQGQVTFGRRGGAPGPSTTARVAADRPAPARPEPVRAPPRPAPEEIAAVPEDVPIARVPFATIVILLFLAVLFVLELSDKPAAKPGTVELSSLIHLGAVSRDFVLGNLQLWRLLTAPWLHLDVAHIVGNSIALLLIGRLLEPIVGWRWFGAVYTLGGIGGALGSIFLNVQSTVSVGASGAILAVIACAAAMSLHPAAVGRRMRIWRMCVLTGIPALIPHAGSHTDYSAHIGGAIVGGLIGWGLLAAWSSENRRPPLEGPVATTGAVVGFLGVVAVAVAAILPPAKLHTHVTAGLIPIDQMPSSEDEGIGRWTDLLVAYPQDPRAHGLAAEAWVKNGGDNEAERELQAGLASPLLHAPEIDPTLERRMRVMLLAVQLKQGEYDAARHSAELLCPVRSTIDPRVQKALAQMKACDDVQ